MNDRFKFRIFSKVAKKFIYFDNSELCVDKENMGLLFRTEHLYLGNYEELQQCTGLKDKNGKFIYENDIVKTLYTKPNGEIINRNCVVEFNRCAFWINYGIGASYLDNDDCIYEVIGNIYENKDLFGKK